METYFYKICGLGANDDFVGLNKIFTDLPSMQYYVAHECTKKPGWQIKELSTAFFTISVETPQGDKVRDIEVLELYSYKNKREVKENV